MIISPEIESYNQLDNNFRSQKLNNILYAKGYTIFPLIQHKDGVYLKSFIASTNEGNSTLKKDSIFFMNEFGKKSVILKYSGQEQIKQVYNNGKEKNLSLNIYDSNLENTHYLYNGISFSFTEQKNYQMITSKDELKKNMVVEYFNNDEWVECTIEDVDREWDRMYRLLIKYNKLRVCVE
jgi:hypothetical protein